MQPQHKYMKQDDRSKSWVYRRDFPKDVGPIDGTRTFVRSFSTSDVTIANRKWSTYDSEYEAKVQQARSLTGFRNSKDKRREKFWLSVARWIEFERSQRSGTQALPQNLSLPTSTEGPVAFHPFEYLLIDDAHGAVKRRLGASLLGNQALVF